MRSLEYKARIMLAFEVTTKKEKLYLFTYNVRGRLLTTFLLLKFEPLEVDAFTQILGKTV